MKISKTELITNSDMDEELLKNIKIDEIISISRGGMVASRILSDLLDLPISHIAIESYADMKQTQEPIVTQVSPREFKGETILLVDEVSDSGKTYIRAMSYLKTLPISKVYTASPYIKPHTKFVPDFYAKSLDKWIVFPYDIRETKEAFIKQFGSEKKAIKKMKELGFEEWELE